MLQSIENKIKNCFRRFMRTWIPEMNILFDKRADFSVLYTKRLHKAKLGNHVKLYAPYNINNVEIDDYTYVATNAIIAWTKIGKFCSIGPNLVCGWGVHPTQGISTAPMFYSTLKQNGISISNSNKIEEHKEITIGNDVFIGANVTILDGVSIGNGAVIGAGAVVSKDIPPYAIAVGCPIQIKKYRFEDSVVDKLLQIKWWNFSEDQLQNVEKYFFEVEKFISSLTTNH
ncbi:MAG: CatB-related O-acetyltransferase [Candidatus Symbiothrix sp.]|nr:CatB-related O-acetyltransferase [Candidatus Symbiothrix sp.]